MADTLDITEGTGTTIATQDEGGVHYQEVKLVASGTGTTEALSKAEDSAHTSGEHGIMALTVRKDAAAALAGTDVDYQPFITDANGRLHVLDANSGAIKTAIELIDNAVDGNYLNVNLNLAGADAGKGENTLDGTELRVTIATDDDGVTHLATIAGDTTNIETAVQLLDNAVYVDDADWVDDTSSHFLVGGVYQSAPHTVTDGDVSPFQLDVNGKILVSGITACNTGAVVLSSGTVTTVSTVTSLTQMGGVAITMGEGALDGGCQRVTLATDDDGVAHLATIAGAVAATHMQCDIIAGTVTTVSTVTNLSQLGGAAITMDEGVHGTGVQRVTIATDDDGVLSLGIIDDWDATHASAASADGPQVMGAGYSAVLPTDVGADGDAARICTDRHGRIVRGLMPQWFNAIFDSANASGEGNTVKAKTASRKIYILSLTISVDTEMWVKLQKEDSTAITPKFWLKAGGGLTKTYPPEAPLVLDTVNVDLEVITEGAGDIGVEVTGYLAV